MDKELRSNEDMKNFLVDISDKGAIIVYTCFKCFEEAQLHLHREGIADGHLKFVSEKEEKDGSFKKSLGM